MPLTITIELGPHATALLLRMEKMTMTILEALNDLTGAVTASTNEIATLVTDLKAALAANDPAQAQATVDAIEAAAGALKSAVEAAKAADPAQTPTPPVAA